MPVVTSDLLAALYTNYRSLWNDAFLAATNGDKFMDKLAMRVESTTLIESYSWFGTVPALREWVGERQLSGLSKVDYTITNKDWEATIEVDRNAIEDSRLGFIRPRIEQLALEAVRGQEQLVIDTFQSLTNLAYDGQLFFDVDHVTPGAAYTTNQSNKLTGTGVTLAALQTDLAAAIAAMRNFKDDQGRPMNIAPTDVLVPPALEGIFRQLLTSQLLPTPAVGVAVNPWLGLNLNLNVSSYLTDVNDWYLLSLNQPVKPMVFQMRRAPEFNALDNPSNNEAAFMRKRYMYGIDGRWNAGTGLWQLVVRTVN